MLAVLDKFLPILQQMRPEDGFVKGHDSPIFARAYRSIRKQVGRGTFFDLFHDSFFWEMGGEGGGTYLLPKSVAKTLFLVAEANLKTVF